MKKKKSPTHGKQKHNMDTARPMFCKNDDKFTEDLSNDMKKAMRKKLCARR